MFSEVLTSLPASTNVFFNIHDCLLIFIPEVVAVDLPAMFEPIRLDESTYVLPAYAPVPGFGILPVNTSVIRGNEPVLVDTGLAGLREDFLKKLERVVDPASLRWIWITHMDPDHVGNLEAVLELAPDARVVTTFLGMGKLGLLGLPQDRVYLLNPGQTLHLADRSLSCLRPPTYDAPETTALFDHATGTYFSADAFGALMEAPAQYAGELSPEALAEGLITWARVDSPWLHWVEPSALRRAFQRIRQLAPTRIVSSHLPPATDLDAQLFEYLEAARMSEPFEGPDQAALEFMMESTAALPDRARHGTTASAAPASQ